MELKSDLAKELFDKVIIPIQNKNKTTITSIVPTNNTVSNTETLLPVSIPLIIKDEQKDELNTSLPEQLTIESDTTLPPLPTSSQLPIEENNTDFEKLLLSLQSTRDVPDTIESTLPSVPETQLNSSSADTVNIMPPSIPMVEKCSANIRDVDVKLDCNPNTQKPKPSAWLRFHPDKNKSCQEDAKVKFQDLSNKCAKYIPSSGDSPTSETPTPTSDEPVSTEPMPKEPISQEPVSQEPISQEPVSQEPVSQEPVSQESISQQPVSTEVIQEPKPDLSKDNKVVKQLVQVLLGVLKKPEVPTIEKSIHIDKEPEDVKNIASCDINDTCQEQPLRSLVNVLSNTLSKPPPAAGDIAIDESGQVNSSFNLPKMPSIDMSGKLNWITQSLAALFATIGGLFTFEPVQDTDPYELMEDKKNQGYIYVGKMYMKPEDTNTKPESVKYISYHPKNKDFFIDERKEV
jgi:hypothetical protein